MYYEDGKGNIHLENFWTETKLSEIAFIWKRGDQVDK